MQELIYFFGLNNKSSHDSKKSFHRRQKQQKDDDKMKNNQDMDFLKTDLCSVGNKEHIDVLKI